MIISIRDFITKIVPACALTCAFGKDIFGKMQTEEQEEAKHMFDQEYPRKLTYKQYYATRYRGYISLARDLEKEFGKEKTIELLKKFTTENWLQTGKAEAKGKSDLSLKAYTRQFNQENFKNLLTLEIIRSSIISNELRLSLSSHSVIISTRSSLFSPT